MNLIKKVSRKIESLLVNKAVVLSYHRIIDADLDPLNLAVSPDNFEQHLKILKSRYNVLPVSVFLDRFREGAVPDKTVCLTFDDGYKDNFLSAKPLLEKYHVPACFFMPSYFLDKQQPFWWDELADLLFTSTRLQKNLRVEIRNRIIDFPIDECFILTDDEIAGLKKWKRRDAGINKRTVAYNQLCQLLLPLAYEEIQSVMSQLREQSSYNGCLKPENLAMTKSDLKEIVNNPLFETGLHTLTHTPLGLHDRLLQRSEIIENKHQLEEIVGAPVHTIAYPNGSFNNTTLNIIREQQLKAGFTTRQASITRFSDHYQFSRYKVINWNGLRFKQKMQEWFNS